MREVTSIAPPASAKWFGCNAPVTLMVKDWSAWEENDNQYHSKAGKLSIDLIFNEVILYMF